MATLHIGVLDIPYSDEGKTTGDVAELLEDKYGLFTVFWDIHGEEVLAAIEESQGAALETMMMQEEGGFAAGQAEMDAGYATATELAKVLFRQFVTMKEMNGLADGVPTKASLEGISHRFKKKRGVPGRPSFIDTGLLLASVAAWVD